MKALKILSLTGVVVLAVVVFAAPIGPLPGVFIGGKETPVPAVWPDTRQLHEIKLQVSGGLVPRVVIIWVVQVDGVLHVVGANDSGWTSMIGNSSPVRIRMDDNTYAMQATRVTSGWEPILAAYVEKYQADYPQIIENFPPLDEAAATTAVFSLTAAAAG